MVNNNININISNINNKENDNQSITYMIDTKQRTSLLSQLHIYQIEQKHQVARAYQYPTAYPLCISDVFEKYRIIVF